MPHVNPGRHGEAESRVIPHGPFASYFRRVETHVDLDVREELFDGPALGEGLDDLGSRHRDVGRREVGRSSSPLRISYDDEPQLPTARRPPCVDDPDSYGDAGAVDVDTEPLPGTTGPGQPLERGQLLPVARTPSPTMRRPGGRIVPELRILPESADERDAQPFEGTKKALVVVGPVRDHRDRQRSPGFHGLQGRDDHLESGPELAPPAVLLWAVELHPEGQRDRNPEHRDDHGQHDPVVAPDEARSRTGNMIEEARRAEDRPTPLGAERIVGGDEKSRRPEGRDDQPEEASPQDLAPELAIREEAIVAREGSAVIAPELYESGDAPLTLAQKPGNGHRHHIWPTPLRERHPGAEDNAKELFREPNPDHGRPPWAPSFPSHKIIGRNTERIQRNLQATLSRSDVTLIPAHQIVSRQCRKPAKVQISKKSLLILT